MIIKAHNQLSEEVIQQIRKVETECNQHDGLTGSLFLDSSMNFNPEINSTFLLYMGEELVSVLSAFFPTPNEVEITGYTLPVYRLQGYFTALLERASQEFRRSNIPEMLFVIESKSESGKGMMKSYKANYDFTEYVLQYSNTNRTEIGSYPYRLQLITPSMSELEEVVRVGQTVFNESYEDAKTMVLRTMESEQRQQYAVTTLDGKYIGIGCASFDDGEVSIYGLGILPEYQGKGFGKELLFLIIKNILEQGKKTIFLEVNSQNAIAYQLYIRSGFQIELAYDYYRKKLG